MNPQNMLEFSAPAHTYEDIKFILYYLNKDTKFTDSQMLSLRHDEQVFSDIDSIISYLFTLNGEAADLKKFKNYQRNPTTLQAANISILVLICYITLVRNMLEVGTLKNKEYIDKITALIQSSASESNGACRGTDFDPDFLMLEIKAGLISSIEHASGMDKLFVEEVMVDKPYHICSGIRDYYQREQLLNKKFLFLLNIKKVKLGTEESEGMICCGENGTEVDALEVNCGINTRIYLENSFRIFENIKYEKIDIKKNKYKASLECFRIVDHFMTFKGKRVMIENEYIKSKVSNGEVK
jgi:aminoacyl tRNA synthase complex-interacting multifunctional protein 1